MLSEIKTSRILDKSIALFQRRIPFLIAVVATYFIFNLGSFKKEKGVIQWDIISYYAYLPATFIYEDLSFEFIDNYQGEHKFVFWLEEGNLIKTTMGMSLLYAPSFFIAHLIALFTKYDAGGFSAPYSLALILNCIFFLWLGLLYLRKLLLRYFSPTVVTVTILLLTFSTGLFYYATAVAPMPHAYNFTLFVLFIYKSIAWHEKGKMKDALILGVLFGLITLVRPGNALICLFFFFFGIYSKASLISRLQHFRAHLLQFLSLLFMVVLVWVPQVTYWKLISGNFVATFYTGESLIFGQLNFLKGMFSVRNGWLIYAPIMTLGIAGIFFLRDQLKSFFLPVLLFTIINTYVVLSWWCWWYTGFGNRAMIEAGAVLAIPLAALIQHAIYTKKLVYKITGITLIVLFGMKGIQHSAQYHFGGLHYNSMTKEAYWHNFFEIKGDSTYWSMLREPNYDNAKLGIDSYMDEINKSFSITFDSLFFANQTPNATINLIENHLVFNTEVYQIIGDKKLDTSDFALNTKEKEPKQVNLKRKSQNILEFSIPVHWHYRHLNLGIKNKKKLNQLTFKRVGTRWEQD